jgi:hypothetical protein
MRTADSWHFNESGFQIRILYTRRDRDVDQKFFKMPNTDYVITKFGFRIQGPKTPDPDPLYCTGTGRIRIYYCKNRIPDPEDRTPDPDPLCCIQNLTADGRGYG